MGKYIEDASRGLAYIMNRVGAISWQRTEDGYVIATPERPKKFHQKYFVPDKNVKEAERELETDTLPMRWVHEDIREIK